ncbi:Protein of unknown function [Thermoactinomyces sp. DSM 45891]|nr:Protein of unknown function [Thermoactinomyces sp. DSM 45891]
MMLDDFMHLYDDTVQTNTRFVGFMGETVRFDLVIMRTDRFYGKMVVMDIQSSKFAIIGKDDLEEEGYLEFAFGISKESAEELKFFLEQTF